MSSFPEKTIYNQFVHFWLRKTHVCFVPGDSVTPLAFEVSDKVMYQFDQLGHIVQYTPDDNTDIILTTAPFGEPISWRKSLTFVGRMKFKLSHSPKVFLLGSAWMNK